MIKQKSDFLNELEKVKLMPAITINNSDKAVPLAKALINGGLKIAEVPMRTPAALESIKRIANETDMLIGAGTVLTIGQAKDAIDAGASIIISPGFNPDVVKFVHDKCISIIPGVATPSEIELAYSYGIDVLKLFPADVMGGPKLLKALYGPYQSVKFIPMGGINGSNMREYLGCPNVFALGGTWIAKSEMIDKGAFEDIEETVRQSLYAIKSATKGI